jgi:organic hydroperoxide reductase OsmC/OhrA
MSRISPFPHRYAVRLEDGRLLAPPRAPIALGAPPQFGGSDQVWSPEDLLVGAVLECLWTTFAAYARREGLEVIAWSGAAEGVLDKGPQGPTFTSIDQSVELTVAGDDEERARRILATAEKHCIVANALRVPVTLEVIVRRV